MVQPAILLFRGGSEGYGDAINVGRDRYHWSFNMDCRALGRATVSNIMDKLSSSTGIDGEATAMFEWVDNSTPNQPIILVAGRNNTQRYVILIQNDSETLENQNTSAGYTDAVLYRESDGTTEMAFFCNGSSEDALEQRSKGASYSRSGHDAKADHLSLVGGDLWRSVGSTVSKLTLDTDPGVDSNWGVAIEVGTPSYPVNKILDFGGSPLVLTGQGVFRYNPSPFQARFDNLTAFVAPHPDNGKGGSMDGRGRIYYPTENEGLLVLTFGAQSQQRPLRFNTIDRDTPFGRIQTLVADDEYVYLALKPGTNRTVAPINKVFTVVDLDGGAGGPTWVDATTNATDHKHSTVVALTDMGANDNYLYILADEPFWGVWIDVAVATTGSATIWRLAYSDTPGSNSFTSISNELVLDSTGGGLRSGLVAFDAGTDIYADGSWTTTTVNSVSGKYGLRLQGSGATTSLTAWRIAIIPYRPPLDTTQALMRWTGQMLAGAQPKILVGSWAGERFIYQDVWTPTSAQIDQLVVGRTTGKNSVGRQTLWAATHRGFYHVAIGPTGDPARITWPVTNSTTIPHVLACSGHDFGLPSHLKSVKSLVVNGEYLQADDLLDIYYKWDNDIAWKKSGPHTPFPVITDEIEGHGRILHVAVSIQDASQDAIAPYISSIEIPEDEWEDEGVQLEQLGPDIASPQEI